MCHLSVHTHGTANDIRKVLQKHFGCQSCVDTRHRGADGQTCTCPRCRGERAYVETCKLNGLDEFLMVIVPLLEDGQGDPDDLVD